jgi:hypothetical protein
MKKQELAAFIDKLGQKYSEILGINLESGEDQEIFKWFLAAILFGAPITETSVLKTYRCFERRGVLSLGEILQTGWHGLVEILDEGGYTRYDYKTADKLLEVMENLKTKYAGSLNLIHQQATDPINLENRLKELGKGIGDVTVGIFLRELRGIWCKANPRPTPLVLFAAKNLGIIKVEAPEKALTKLQDFWRKMRLRENHSLTSKPLCFVGAEISVGKNKKEATIVASDCFFTELTLVLSQLQLDSLLVSLVFSAIRHLQR